MPRLLRVYDAVLADHLQKNRQMAFVSGPRQVGKTNCCMQCSNTYWNWDRVDIQAVFIRGAGAIAEALGIGRPRSAPLVVTFDEVHKYAKWKNVLKGFFDTYADQAKILVTGSSRLDIYRRGSDSLMGRYFLYRMHPLSVAELLHSDMPATAMIRPPSQVASADWDALWRHGGFPEPFLRRNDAFSRRWRSLRLQQLTKDDLREVTLLQEIGIVEVLTQILAERSGQQVVYANLAEQLSVSAATAKRWVDILERMNYGFLIRPWSSKLTNAIRKEPKWYLRDWSGVPDPGRRAETFVACHLLKAVEGWTDLGLADLELRYLRNKQGAEVDFLVVRDRKPWMLVEVKASDASLSPRLLSYQQQLGTEFAFQVVLDLPYENIDCFRYRTPVVVPARTFLSQLL